MRAADSAGAAITRTSTLLDLVAGLARPDAGEIRLGDRVLFSSETGVDLPPEERRAGYVFQEDLLFPISPYWNVCGTGTISCLWSRAGLHAESLLS